MNFEHRLVSMDFFSKLLNVIFDFWKQTSSVVVVHQKSTLKMGGPIRCTTSSKKTGVARRLTFRFVFHMVIFLFFLKTQNIIGFSKYFYSKIPISLWKFPNIFLKCEYFLKWEYYVDAHIFCNCKQFRKKSTYLNFPKNIICTCCF